MESMRAHFEREAETDSNSTSYNSSLGRVLLNTAKFLKKEPVKVAAAAVASVDESAAILDSQPMHEAVTAVPSVPQADKIILLPISRKRLYCCELPLRSRSDKSVVHKGRTYELSHWCAYFEFCFARQF